METTTLMTRTQPEGRVQHRTRVEQSILAATHGLLADRAAADVTIADIMDAVGLSRTAFYRYFPDVNAVLVRLLREIRAQFVGAWLECPDDADFVVLLRGDAHENVARFVAHGAIIAACLDSRTSAPELFVAWLEIVEEVVAEVAERIGDLNRRGVTNVGSAYETARALVTFTIYYVTEGLARTEATGTEALEETLAAVWYRTIFAEA